MKTTLATIAALVAFAGNSLLCRAALEAPSIDAASFTAIRLASGAAVLWLIVWAKAPRRAAIPPGAGDWTSASALLAYAVAFSLAYRSLSAGVGALLLFGAVQATMIAWGLARGERPRWPEWVGLAVASGGLVYLVSPGLTAPPLGGTLLMLTAGAAWGVYSLRGRGAASPTVATAGNFLRAAPLALAIAAASFMTWRVSPRGALLAAISGAATSGLGYAVWYTALRGLTATRAAIVQLAVPIIASAGGALWLGEWPTARLMASGVAVLGGVAMAVLARQRPSGDAARIR